MMTSDTMTEAGGREADGAGLRAGRGQRSEALSGRVGRLPPRRVIRPAAEVVKGDVEVVREGDEIVEDRGTIAVFISLVANG